MRPFELFVESKKTVKSREDYMALALKAAKRAASKGDVPIGALLVSSDQVMSDHNTVYSEEDMTNHAEMNVMRKASSTKFGRLKSAILYSTVEPCAMCAAAAYWNGITEIVFGAFDDKHGFVSSKNQGLNLESFKLKHTGGILGNECFDVLTKKLKEYCRAE